MFLDIPCSDSNSKPVIPVFLGSNKGGGSVEALLDTGSNRVIWRGSTVDLTNRGAVLLDKKANIVGITGKPVRDLSVYKINMSFEGFTDNTENHIIITNVEVVSLPLLSDKDARKPQLILPYNLFMSFDITLFTNKAILPQDQCSNAFAFRINTHNDIRLYMPKYVTAKDVDYKKTDEYVAGTAVAIIEMPDTAEVFGEMFGTF